MVTPKTGRPRGRPTKTFLNDPERYLIAFSDSLQMKGFKEKASFDLTAANIVGEVMEFIDRGNGHANISWESARPGRPSITIPGKSDTIRGKSKNRTKKGQPEKTPSAEEHMWRHTMAFAFYIAGNHQMSDKTALFLRLLADSIGENAFAEAVLIPMLKCKKFQPPDFSPPD